MATLVSVKARPAPAKAMAVSIPYRYQQAKATPVSGERAAWSTGPRCDTRGRRQGLAGRPVGGEAWPGTKTTHRATRQHTRHHRCEGRRRDLPRCRWAVAGPGRASRRRAERSSRRGRLAGGPPPTGTHSGRALRRPEHQRRPAHQRRPEHPWGHTRRRNTSGATRHLDIAKPPGPTGAGRLSQDQRLTAGPRRCRGLRGRSPGERWKYRAWRQRPSRSPPCGDPRRRRWRSAWPSRQHSRRRCPRSRPG